MVSESFICFVVVFLVPIIENGTKIEKSAPVSFSFSVGIYNTKLPFGTSVSLEIELYLFLRKYLQVY